MLSSDRYKLIEDASSALYEAAVGLGAWESALAKTATACGSESAVLFSQSLGYDPRVPTHMWRFDLTKMINYLMNVRQVDPWTMAAQMKGTAFTSPIFHGEAVLPDAELLRLPIYHDYLAKHDSRRIVSIATKSLNVEDAPRMMLTLKRGVKSQSYGAEDLEAARRLAQHVDAAVNLNIRARHKALVSAATLFDGEDAAIALLGAGRLLLHGNAAFHAVLRDSQAVRVTRGIMHFAPQAEAIGQACDRLLATADITARRPAFFPVSPAPGTLERRYVMVAPLPVRLAEALSLDTSLILLRLAGRPTGHDRACEAAAQAMNLSRAETRILRHMMSGAGPDEIAAQVGTSPGTVRSQIKSIFGKAGIHRQSHLVAHVLTTFDPALRLGL